VDKQIAIRLGCFATFSFFLGLVFGFGLRFSESEALLVQALKSFVALL
jgi:hypothetical protein